MSTNQKLESQHGKQICFIHRNVAHTHVLQDARKSILFESFPQVLQLQLRRFEFDSNTNATVKVLTLNVQWLQNSKDSSHKFGKLSLENVWLVSHSKTLYVLCPQVLL